MSGRLTVKNWSKFQHYHDRCPPWIKLATDTFQNPEFAELSTPAKLLVICIWTLASRSKDGTLSDNFSYISRWGFLDSDITEKHLQELIDEGFILEGDQSSTKEKWPSRYIPFSVRNSVLIRDGVCQKCGSSEKLEIDHIVPVSKGGTSVEDNLQVLCRSCNRRKRVSVAKCYAEAEQDATQSADPRSLEAEAEAEKRREEDDMKASKEIPGLCRQILGRDAEKTQFTWSKVKELEADHGGFAVVHAFTNWAQANKLVEFQAPVAAFLKEAEDLLGSPESYTPVGRLQIQVSENNTELAGLCADMCEVSDQSFTGKLRSAVAALLAVYSALEILEAWKQYIDPMDDSGRRLAPKNFCEGAAIDTLTVRRRRAANAVAQAELISEIEKREQAKAEAENVVEEEIEEPL